jgi:hypothetical protein
MDKTILPFNRNPCNGPTDEGLTFRKNLGNVEMDPDSAQKSDSMKTKHSFIRSLKKHLIRSLMK